MMAEYELPVVHSPAPLMGGTGPITMASGLAMSLTEIFSSLVVHQLKRPGAPFIFGAGLHHLDMKASQICYASAEFQLTKAAIAELGRWYGLPTWGYAGCSDAKVMDEQAALEAMLSIMMAEFSGGNLIHDVGYMESGLTCSFEMIVLCDELIALMENLMKGIDTSPDNFMLDEIHTIGPGGHFLNTDQTLSRFRYFWYPQLIDRNIRSTWLKKGGSTLGERLNTKAKEIIQEHSPKPLDQGIKAQINEILSKA
jgi:trimethylamine--corrinoid protein Co-methyltransferase